MLGRGSVRSMPRRNRLDENWRRRRKLAREQTGKLNDATEKPTETSTGQGSGSTPDSGGNGETQGELVGRSPGTAIQKANPLRTAQRDSTGFIEGDLPQLSVAQYKWILARSQVADDAAACLITETPEILVWDWKQDPGFSQVLDLTLSNRREGFKVLGTYLLPKALRKIEQLIDSDDSRANARGITLLLRSQGMLVDKVAKVDRSALDSLMESLREARPIKVIEAQATEVIPSRTIFRDEGEE